MRDGNYRVVLVEDNPADVLMIKLALRQKTNCDFTVLSDGEAAYQYFANWGVDETLPELVVLDLNLPSRSGTEVLELIRGQARLSGVRVAVVSSSPKDMMKAKLALVDCYVIKPFEVAEYLSIGTELLDTIPSGKV